MRLSRFYVEEDLLAGQIYALGTDLTHYLRNVLRVKSGDKIMLFNGQGGEYLAQIEAVSKKEVSAIVIQFEPSNRESELHLCLGVSVVKRDAMDTIIQKSTELGVSEIQPLIADLTTVSAKAIKQRVDHWRGIAISACEQCGRNTLPALHSPVATQEWIPLQTAELKLAMDPSGDYSLMDQYHGKEVIAHPKRISVLIGPEGGLSENELQLTARHGYLATRLGPRILRADTAPVAVLSILQARFGDFSSSAKASEHIFDSI